DEHVELPRLELRHQLAPLGGTQAAVHEAYAVALQLAFAEPFGLAFRSTRDRGLGLLDERTDDVCLPPVVEVLPEPLVRRARPVLRDPARDHRLPVGRRLRALAHLEVAVAGEREG